MINSDNQQEISQSNEFYLCKVEIREMSKRGKTRKIKNRFEIKAIVSNENLNPPFTNGHLISCLNILSKKEKVSMNNSTPYNCEGLKIKYDIKTLEILKTWYR